ncbi:hypothetical protein BGZ63DRAFT_379438 [Mariannaea sp. PMI_226]|nr:hypothetical protein BGZ63DRAFT_379438 [Mariannaea sp. PMI_226]
MDPTQSQMIALYVLQGLLVLTVGISIYHLHILNDPNKPFKQAIAQALMALAGAIAGTILTWMEKGNWPIFLGLWPIIAAVLRECLWLRDARSLTVFANGLLGALIFTIIGLITGCILSIWEQQIGMIIIIISATCYRGWIAFEWLKLHITANKPVPQYLYYIILNVAVFGGTPTAFQSISTSIYTGLLIISYFFVFLDLLMAVGTVQTIHGNKDATLRRAQNGSDVMLVDRSHLSRHR